MLIESTIREQYASTGTALGQNGLAASRPSVKATIWPLAAPSSSTATSALPPPNPLPALRFSIVANDLDHAPAIIEAHRGHFDLRLEGCADGLIHGREDSVARGMGRRSWSGFGRQLHLPAKPRHNFLGELRD